MKEMKKVLAFFLCIVMVLGFVPASAFAALAAETETTVPQEDTALTAALAEAKTYIDGITINNSSNDPEAVVKNFKTHFTWDNEKRENSKDYLFDWSYYNGVVFEGLEYVYEVTGEEVYKDYVVEYMSNLIAANGTWAKTSNNSSMTAAGYNATHGADCYKTASLLLDAYEMTGDDRYLTMAATLYADLDSAAKTYSLENAGNNFRHTWATNPTPDLWLDGLYMILPFRAEYAKHIGDAEELNLIVSRMQWVSDNMYNSSNGLFYHAADSASSNSGTHWLRSIGWYAAAMVDVMDSMEGENLEAMKAQLVKFVDGMKAVQNASNGMWLNNMNASQSSNNPYETSGTALTCYAIMKAVNNGWLDESYADMAILAFKGICDEKLENNNLTDICFKGTPGDSNSTFYDNEGKGVGPFIMFYAEVLEYVSQLAAITVTFPDETEYEPGDELDLTGLTVTAYNRNGKDSTVTDGYTVSDVDMATAGTKTVTVTYQGLTASFEITVIEPETEPEPTEPVKEEVDVAVGEETFKVTVENVSNVVTGEASAEDKALVEAENFENVLVFDMNAELVDATKAIISIPVPAGWDQNRIVGISVEDGVVKKIRGTVENGIFSFKVGHFSAKGIALAAETDVLSGNSNLVGGTTYTLDTDGEIDTSKTYLIVNTSSDTTSGHALTNNGTGLGDTTVTVSDEKITVEDDSDIAWTISGTSNAEVSNNNDSLGINNGSLDLDGDNLTISDQEDGEYRIYRTDGSNRRYYVRWYYGSWTGTRVNSSSSTAYSVYLYERTSSSDGEAVTFAIDPSTTTIQPGKTLDLNGVVTVGDEEVDLDDCDITWTPGDEDILTVSNGVVTGKADGTTTVKAILSAANNTALTENIELLVTITVQSKKITSATLSGNDPVTTDKGVEPDFSNIKLNVTYDDGTTGTITVDNGLVIEGYDINTIGYSYATISYGGVEYGNVRVTVEGNPYAGKDEATTYPEYPADGAVRIDKTATEIDFENTGVVQVELDVAGISVKQGVDVVLVADISNSMAWKAGEKNVSPDASEGETTKWQDLQAAAGTFIDTLLLNEDGSATNNTVSFVTFGGYDAERNNNSSSNSYSDYFDATRTVFTSYSDAVAAKNRINAFSITGNDGDGYNVTVEGEANSTPQGGTNYDYAFLEAAAAINQIKSEYAAANDGADYDESGRQIYVVFMTDGAPDHYNQLYYKTRSNTAFDYYALYRNSSDFLESEYFDVEGHTLPSAYTFNQRQDPNGYYIPTADMSNANWISWLQSDSLYAAEQVAAMESVYSITSIGFDLENGAFSTFSFSLEVLSGVLRNLAGENSCEVFTTSNASALEEFYKNLATEIKYAGTQAQATDVIGSDFTLQLTQTTGTAAATQHGDLGFKPTITIKAYDLYPKGSVDANGKDITGERTGDVTPIETVTFSDDGTEAYSTLVENGNKNIMSTASDGTVTIEAHYFTYTKTLEGVETFKWNIGNITDKEIALSFYAYLKGSLEGTESKGLKYTNEEATVEYIDINGDHATKIFPVPGVAWGGASTSYEFYLVNEQGQPCDRQGNVIPFANRVIITGPYYEELYLNQAGEYVSKDIIAAKVLPAGYTLYDSTAKYTVVTASGDLSGSLTISETYVLAEEGYTGTLYQKVTDENGKDSYVESENGTYKKLAQTTILVSATTPSYIQSRVAFGVLYNLIPDSENFEMTPDEVVIDYGKSVLIDITNNNQDLINDERSYESTLVGFAKYYDDVDLNTSFRDMEFLTEYDARYGDFSISDADNCIVKYTPTGMMGGVEQIFCVIKVVNNTNATDWFYMVDQLTVIPATVMYYETNFAQKELSTGFFTADSNWANYNDTVDSTADADQIQSVVKIGTDLYGYDPSYTDDGQFSDRHSFFATGEGVDDTYVTFSFTGTGFDLISSTGTDQGLIKVQVATDKAMTNVVKTVSVLNKSESNLELYQIPVVSINNLGYGTYYVKIGVDVSYTNQTGLTALDRLNRGNQFFFDAIRIYDPIDVTNGATAAEGTDANIAFNAYVADGEASMKLTEIRANLLAAGVFDTYEGADLSGVVFVDRYGDEDKDGIADETGVPMTDEVGMNDYTTIGPNNEVYLVGDQAIGFNLTLDPNNLPASIDLGLKSADGRPVVPYIEVQYGDSDDDVIYTFGEGETTINSATVQFYDLLKGNPSVLSGQTEIYVFVSNYGEGILSVTDLKCAWGNAAGNVSIVSSEETVKKTVETVQGKVDKDAAESEVNYDVISAAFTAESVKRNQTVTLVIETSENVESITVQNAAGKEEKITVDSMEIVDGVKIWTVTFKINATGTKTFTVTGYGANGNSGTTASATIKVTR